MKNHQKIHPEIMEVTHHGGNFGKFEDGIRF
jgi:hypothetical protein